MNIGTQIEQGQRAIHIDLSKLPTPIKEHLAAVTCEGVLDFFSQPDVPEAYEKWLQERETKKEG